MPVNAACLPALTAIPDLVSLWLLDEGSGLTFATDSIGPNDLTLSNPHSDTTWHWLADPIACDGGTALHLNANQVRFQITEGASTGLEPATLTVFAWVRRSFDVSTGAGSDSLVGKDTSYGLSVSSLDDTLGMTVVRAAGPFVTGRSTTPLLAGEGHFVCGTFDGANIRVYVDGVLESTTACAGPIDYTGSTLFALGLDPLVTGGARADLDDVGVVARALSDADILALYNACRCHAAMRARVWLVS